MKTRPTTEDLISYAHGTAGNEVDRMLDELCREDLTAGEMVATEVILRGARERKQAAENPPAVLKMVRPRKRKRA